MENKPSKLALGVALFTMGLILISKSQEVNRASSATFAYEPVSIEGFDGGDIQKSMPGPKKIVIPSLGIDIDVEIAQIVNGYWEVFEDKAGWGQGSGYPGQAGNQVIFAHAKDGLFSPLQSIKVGEPIYVLTDTLWFSYEVVERKEVSPDQTKVIEPTEDEILTLYTCSGYKDSKRLIVKAKPI